MSGEQKTAQNDTEVDTYQQASLHALTHFAPIVESGLCLIGISSDAPQGTLGAARHGSSRSHGLGNEGGRT